MQGFRRILTTFTLLVTLLSCSGNELLVPSSRDGRLHDAEAYLESSPYAAVLGDCVRTNCKFSTLPLVGMEYDDPSIDNIMNRVVVSHAWMGMRFEQLLNALPSDMLSLFKNVTAIVIDGDVRPSYYTDYSGAIYLDPASLWLTVPEKDTIRTDPDYRSGFSDPLMFKAPWRYLLDNQYAWRGFSLHDQSERQLEDIVFPMAQLLLHELAHANDFFPYDEMANISRDLTPQKASEALVDRRLSSRLANLVSELESTELKSLANVYYRGRPPTEEQANFTAATVGEMFAMDVASDFYPYSSPFEDLAMLFEEVMMKYFFDLDRDIAFVSSEGWFVGWGQRNRVGELEILPRAEWAARAMFPNIEFGDFFMQFPTPRPLPNGRTWGDTLNLDAQQAGQMQKPSLNKTEYPEDLLRPYDIFHGH